MRSYKLRTSRRRRVFARFLGKIQHAILQALEEEHEKRGLTRAEIARILNTDKGSITKKLNGTRNMTIETIADFAYAMDREDIQISFPDSTERSRDNNKIIDAATAPDPMSIKGAERVLAYAA